MFVYIGEPLVLLLAGIIAVFFLGYPAATGLTIAAWVVFRCWRSMRRRRMERKVRQAILTMAAIQAQKGKE